MTAANASSESTASSERQPAWMAATATAVALCLAAPPSVAMADDADTEAQNASRAAVPVSVTGPLAPGLLRAPMQVVTPVPYGYQEQPGQAQPQPQQLQPQQQPQAYGAPYPAQPGYAPYGQQPGYAPYPQQPGYAYGPQGQPVDPALMAEYSALPRRGGTITLGIFGGIFLLTGVSQTLSAAFVGCGSYYGYYGTGDCSERNVMLGVGLAQVGAGALMTIFTIRRAHRRRAGIESLRQRGMYWVENDGAERPRLTMDLSISPHAVVPTLGMVF